MLKKEEVERAFLGIIQLVKEDTEGMEAPEESMPTEQPKWDSALPSQIRAVLEEFDDVFPQDLPLGFLQCTRSMNSGLIWRMTCPRSIALFTR